MKNSNSQRLTISPSDMFNNIVKIRELWICLNKQNKFLWLNSLNPEESLMLINRVSAMKDLTPIGLTVQFDLDIGCVANCIMCNTREAPVSGKSYERISALLDYIDLPIVSCVSLIEGEPLMDKSGLISFMKKCLKKKIKFSMTTNALLLSKGYIDLLVKEGLKDIVISLDSYYAQEHDRIRRVKGIFDSAVDSIKYFKQKYPHVKVSINSVIMRINVNSVPRIIRLADKLKVDALNIIYILDKGRNFRKLSLKNSDRKRLETMRNSQLVSHSKVFINWDLCNPLKETGCNNRYYKLIIEETGEIGLCKHYIAGRKFFLNKPLDEIFSEKKFRDYFCPDKFPCTFDLEDSSHRKNSRMIKEADKCEYNLNH